MARQGRHVLALRHAMGVEDGPRTMLRIIIGGAQGGDRPRPAIAAAARAQLRRTPGWDRGANEGGSFAFEAADGPR